MAYKSILTALLESNSCMYILVADSTNDLPNLPNLSQAGETADTRHFAKVGSCVRVVSDGHWYALAPSNEWKAMYCMSDEVDDAISQNVKAMQEIMASTEKYRNDAASSKNDAASSAKKANASAVNADRSAKDAKSAAEKAGADAVVVINNGIEAKMSEMRNIQDDVTTRQKVVAYNADKTAVSLQNAKAAEAAVKNDLQSVAEAKVEIYAIKSATDETLEQCKGYACAASFAFGPDSDGNFSFFVNEDDPE